MSEQTALTKYKSPALARHDAARAVAPACDVYESNEEILVVADVPGVTDDGLNVNLDKGELTVLARREVSAGDGSFAGMEYPDCEFRRRFAVPGGIDESKINAELKDGVLWLHLPKSEQLRPRQIAVRAG
jgi:HSP20 family protein